MAVGTPRAAAVARATAGTRPLAATPARRFSPEYRAGLRRPAFGPAARDGRVMVFVAAFTGTLMQLLTGTFPGAGPVDDGLPTFAGGISVVVSIASYRRAVRSLTHLRRNLSVIPEARRLVPLVW